MVEREALIIARHGPTRTRCEVLKSRPEVESLGRAYAENAVLWRSVGQAWVHDVGRVRGDPVTGHRGYPYVDRILTFGIQHDMRSVRVARAFRMYARFVLQ